MAGDRVWKLLSVIFPDIATPDIRIFYIYTYALAFFFILAFVFFIQVKYELFSIWYNKSNADDIIKEKQRGKTFYFQMDLTFYLPK